MVTSEPTPGEIMRRLDDISRQLARVVDQVARWQTQAERTYVRQDVYLAQRQADQAVIADVAGDLRAVEQRHAEQTKRVESLEDKRIQARNFAITTMIAVAGLGLAILAIIANRGG